MPLGEAICNTIMTFLYGRTAKGSCLQSCYSNILLYNLNILLQEFFVISKHASYVVGGVFITGIGTVCISSVAVSPHHSDGFVLLPVHCIASIQSDL